MAVAPWTTRKLDPINTSFLTITPLVALFGLPWYLYHWDLPSVVWALFGFYMVATGLSITGGYHRLFSHRAYAGNAAVKLFYLVFGAAACQNSALKWSADHRRHHLYVDHDADPYNIKEGFFWAHIGWICFKDPKTDVSNVKDLQQDRLIMWQHRWYVALAIGVGFVLPFVFGLMFGLTAAVGSFLLVGVARTVIVHHSTFLINSLCHYFGRQNYSAKDSSRDSALIALLTYGEGYHNFHHRFQFDYRNGIRWFHWDPTKWFVRGLAAIGWTWDLKTASDEVIFRARLDYEHEKARERLHGMSEELRVGFEHRMQAAREALLHARLRLRELRLEYQAVRSSMDHKRQELALRLRRDLQLARAHFRQRQASWKGLLQDASAARLTTGAA